MAQSVCRGVMGEEGPRGEPTADFKVSGQNSNSGRPGPAGWAPGLALGPHRWPGTHAQGMPRFPALAKGRACRAGGTAVGRLRAAPGEAGVEACAQSSELRVHPAHCPQPCWSCLSLLCLSRLVLPSVTQAWCDPSRKDAASSC